MFAPLAINVAVCCPEQIAELFTDIVGNVFTVTVEVMFAVQPFISDPTIV